MKTQSIERPRTSTRSAELPPQPGTRGHAAPVKIGDPMDKPGCRHDALPGLFSFEVDTGVNFGVSGPGGVSRVAEKLVATAFLRSMLGYPATDLEVDETGGTCKGTAMRIPESSAIDISMAGFVWEHRESDFTFDELITSPSKDLEEARRIICNHYFERHGEDCPLNGGPDTLVYQKLATFLLSIHINLQPHADFIQRVGRLLAKKGRMSGGWFDFWYRDYERRLEKLDGLDVRF